VDKSNPSVYFDLISEMVFRVLSDSISSRVGFDTEMLFVLLTVPDEGDSSLSLSLSMYFTSTG